MSYLDSKRIENYVKRANELTADIINEIKKDYPNAYLPAIEINVRKIVGKWRIGHKWEKEASP